MSGSGWTTHDEQVLRKYYPNHGPSWTEWQILLPGRSMSSIANHASIIGLKVRVRQRTKVQKKSTWTAGQRAALLRNSMRMVRETGHGMKECVIELIEFMDSVRTR